MADNPNTSTAKAGTEAPKPNAPSNTSTQKADVQQTQEDPAAKPADGDTAGTSRQPHQNEQQNNQVLNPDVENAAGNAAAPGVVPTNQVNQAPAPTSDAIEKAAAGNEPEPHVAVPGEDKQEYRLKAGKHHYTDPKTGESRTARADDPNNNTVWLTASQYDNNHGRFERIQK